MRQRLSTKQGMETSLYKSRRLLLDMVTGMPPSNGDRTSDYYTSEANFDSNMVIILAALLCALVCALGINSIVRCVLRCSYRVAFETSEQAVSRLAATTGLKQSSLSQIPVVTYKSGLNIPGTSTDCPICLGEFAEGEKVRVLPKCNHSFHVKCIDKWLLSQSSCPLCRQPLLDQLTSYGNVEEVNLSVQLQENAVAGR